MALMRMSGGESPRISSLWPELEVVMVNINSSQNPILLLTDCTRYFTDIPGGVVSVLSVR